MAETYWTSATGGSRGWIKVIVDNKQDDPANNRSLVRVALELWKNGYQTAYSSNPSYWAIATSFGSWSGSFTYNFGTQGDYITLYNADHWVTHGANGTYTTSVQASISPDSPLTYTDIGTQYKSFTDYYREPYAPGAPSLARTAGTGTVTVTSQTADGRGLGITDYHWQYSTNGVNWSGAIGMGTGRVATLNGALGTTYWVQTRAATSEGWSGWSSATTIAIPNTPAAPASISATRAGRNVAVSCGIADGRGATVTGYRVQYSTDNGATWSTPQTMTGQSYTYSQLPAAKTYIFRCYAVNEMGNGLTRTSSSLWVPAGGMVGVNGAWVYASNVYVGVNGTWVPASNVKVGSAGQWVNAN